jgi:predicted nucleic acid-binding protein
VIALDTTVLVYAKSGDHPLAASCRRLVAAVADGRVEAATTAEVVQEFVHVYGGGEIVPMAPPSVVTMPSCSPRSSR